MNLWSGYLMVLISRAVIFEKGTQPEYTTNQEDQVTLNRSPEICLKFAYKYLLKADHVPGDTWVGASFGARGIS